MIYSVPFTRDKNIYCDIKKVGITAEFNILRRDSKSNVSLNDYVFTRHWICMYSGHILKLETYFEGHMHSNWNHRTI